MTSPLPVPYLSDNQLQHHAEAFLAKHHRTKHPPIPIEHIIEFQFQINIVPVPGLEEAFEIVGFTSSDLTEITVDQYVYEHQPGRYRFTLAHEIAHVVLHADIFREHRFRTTDQWKRFVHIFPELDFRRLEWQAHSFAGLILVPGNMLRQEVSTIARQVKAKSVIKDKDFAKALVTELAAEYFDVSAEVIERRLHRERLDLETLWS